MFLAALLFTLFPATQPPPPVPSWLSELHLMSDPDERVQLLLPSGEVHWVSNAGPQTWLQLCWCDEIMYGGRRGGGKSNGLIAWMASGDPNLPDDDPAHFCYLNDPSFRGLFLRECYKDLRDFVDEAREFLRPFDVTPKDDPVIFEFPSHAKIYTDHLGSEEAYNKYRGWALTRIGIEELSRIPKQSQYIKLFGSLRPKLAGGRVWKGRRFPPLKTQIVSTTNPDGPGAPWVTARFVDVYSGGELIPWNTPMQDPTTKLWRIFIPAGLKDNPYLANDPTYLGMLLSQDETTKKQWIHGDWHAQTGRYFTDYRPMGPVGDEERRDFPQARHVIDSAELKPWWHRWGSGDWGYDHPAAFHKYCKAESDKRIHVYDELTLRKVSNFEMGVELAKWWAPELDELPDHQITLYLSPDAFSLRKAFDQPHTQADQIAAGVKSVLGPYGALLLHYNDAEQALAQRDPKAAAVLFEARRQAQAGKVCILLQRAPADRMAGWTYMRDLLRFRPIVTDIKPDAAHLVALYQHQGVEAYERELAKYAKRPAPEVVPKLQIWRKCKELDRCLQYAVHDEGPKAEDVKKVDAEDGVGGDDAIDSARMGLLAFKEEIEARTPKSVWVRENIEIYQEAQKQATGEVITDPTRLMMMEMVQKARYDQAHGPKGGSATPQRAGRPRYRKW